MKQYHYIPRYSSQKNLNTNILFPGIGLRWQALTQSEKVVALGIIFIPLWWCISWSFMLGLWVVAVAIYEILSYQKIRLEFPSLAVIALLIFSIDNIITYALNSHAITPRGLLEPILSWGCCGLLLWYIQTHKIRVRLQVIAWAFSVIICLMLLWWLFFFFVLNEPHFVPPRNLFAAIFDKGTQYDPSKMGSIGNYLVPYIFGEPGIGGLHRYTFFFPHPTISSFAIGFAGLIVLDLKKHYWSFSIFVICGFLILICQTRNAWLSLSIVLVIRWLVKLGKAGKLSFLLIIFAISSLITLSIPPVTDWLTEKYTNTVEATSNLRKDSTDVRQKIYFRTWESFIEEPFLGHGVNGSPVLPGYEFALIGTESFILGALLYKSGLLGTGCFLVFFIAFLNWLYKTRNERPLSIFMMLLYLSLSSAVTEFNNPELFMILLCAMLRDCENQKLGLNPAIKKYQLS